MMGADPGGLAVAALCVCAATVPDKIRVQVKVHDAHWFEPARLWAALVGDPSTKKSPILTQVVRALIRLDSDMFRQFVSEQARFEALSKEEKATATAPRNVRLRLADATIEAAQEVLKDSHEGLLLPA